MSDYGIDSILGRGVASETYSPFMGIAQNLTRASIDSNVIELTGGDFAAFVSELWRARLSLLKTAGGVADLSFLHSPAPGNETRGLGYYIPQPVGSAPYSEVELGERTRVADYRVALPVASDVWYLCAGQTIVPFARWGLSNEENAEATEDMERYIVDRLNRAYPRVEIMRRVMDASDVNVNSAENRGMRSLKEMRSEVWGFHTSNEFGARYPNGLRQYHYDAYGNITGFSMPQEVVNPSLDDGAYLLGYLAFPVGPMGVMQSLSIVLEEAAPSSSPDWHRDDILKTDVHTGGWGGLFPHKVNSNDNRCWGMRVLRSMYVPDGNRAEYPAEDFHGFDRHYMHQWLRVYLRSDDKWPMPGTLVFMMARPSPLHCWWYQRSSPFAYAGNFFETRHWSSGVVSKVLSEEEKNDGEIGQILVVETCGATLYIRCTDFYGYVAGERVALLKLATPPIDESFKWHQMSDAKHEEMMDKKTERPSDLKYVVSLTYRVAPIEFYQ